jgi:dynein heavy chain 1
MQFTRLRVLTSTFSLLNKGVHNVLEYNAGHADLPMPLDRVTQYIQQWLLFALMWGVGGSLALSVREQFSRALHSWAVTPLPDANGAPLLDFAVALDSAEWVAWSARVPRLDIETHQVGSPDVVIATVDTVRHEAVLRAWLYERRPLILCGPPGSGKTMTLQATLQVACGGRDG